MGVSQWSYYTLELRRLEDRLERAGIDVVVKSRVVEINQSALRLSSDASGSWRTAGCFIPVTLRIPSSNLMTELSAREAHWKAAGIRSVHLIGDALAPGTVAAAVYAGAMAARDLGAARPGHFRRERIVLDARPPAAP
jgi:dimethylamine/trimethylamine dehydrogenase